MKYTLRSLMEKDGFFCPACQKTHFGGLNECLIEDNALRHLNPLLKKYGAGHPYVLCDRHTYPAAGEAVCSLLQKAGIPHSLHVVDRDRPAPDERLVGEAVMYMDRAADGILVCGSGVLNDTGKILAKLTGKPYILVATAPSMDGFASSSSSMERGGFKLSLSTRCPDAVIGDISILRKAPRHMIASGIGDMLAKYVSLTEWRIAALLLGEPYCETVAAIVSTALQKCMESGPAAVRGDGAAIRDLMEGLVLSGLAMNYAGISRPASGMEHYISHIIDMRSLAFHMPSDLHGIQCGIGTLMTVRAYEKLLQMQPDKEKALLHAASFDKKAWSENLRAKLGPGADPMIEGESRERKYDCQKHAERLEKILSGWKEITAILSELPGSQRLKAFMEEIGHPTSFEQIGLTKEQTREAFCLAQDVRDKYVLGRLLWDLGLDADAFSEF